MESVPRALIVILCLVGLYVSFFMLRKYIRAQRGQLDEPSVVTSARAKVARVPNAMIGLVYYAFMLLLTPFLSRNYPIVMDAALIAALAAAVSSLYLAYSLLFVTRMPCRYCWTGHVINWSLLGLVIVIARSG
jgi:uncharacterized membrane protein